MKTTLTIQRVIFLTLIAVLTDNVFAQQNLKLVYSWKYLEFQFPTEAARKSAIDNKQFIRGNPFPIDFDVYYGANYTMHFVTCPRFFDGTPITLGYISAVTPEGQPIISSYPDYSWQQTGNCNGFTSVFRVFVDECERLWVMDTGSINDEQVCPPQLVVFNLRTKICEYIYKFPENLIKTMSLFITPIVDVRTCADTKVYIADVQTFAVVVFDYLKKKAWRVQNSLFSPTRSNSTFTIAGETFDLMDGVFGMSVSPKTAFNRQLFFHPLASISEYSVPLSVLDNDLLWQSNPNASPGSFVKIGQRDNSQSTVEAMDKNGNLFFGTLRPLGIGCWESTKPYTKDNLKLVVQNSETLQFISGLKIVKNYYGEQELWTLSCRFQKIFRGTRNINEINYRVQGETINLLLNRYTQCNGIPFPRIN